MTKVQSTTNNIAPRIQWVTRTVCRLTELELSTGSRDLMSEIKKLLIDGERDKRERLDQEIKKNR